MFLSTNRNKKAITVLLILCLLISCAACGTKNEEISKEPEPIIEQEPVEEQKDPNAGITLELADGTIIRPGDDAYLLANGGGVVVRYNGTPTTEYAADVNGNGLENTLGGGRPGWFRCETNDSGKLFLFVLDSCDYVLSIESNGEIAQFDVDASKHFVYNIAMGSKNIEPGKGGH